MACGLQLGLRAYQKSERGSRMKYETIRIVTEATTSTSEILVYTQSVDGDHSVKVLDTMVELPSLKQMGTEMDVTEYSCSTK